jgi:hypothetical protein
MTRIKNGPHPSPIRKEHRSPVKMVVGREATQREDASGDVRRARVGAL